MGNQPPVYLRSDVLLTEVGKDCNRRGIIKLMALRDGKILQRSFFFQINQVALSPVALIVVWDHNGIFVSFSSKDRELKHMAGIGPGEKVLSVVLSFSAVHALTYTKIPKNCRYEGIEDIFPLGTVCPHATLEFPLKKRLNLPLWKSFHVSPLRP